MTFVDNSSITPWISISPFYQLRCHELALPTLFGVLLQEVGKEEHLQHDKNDEQFDEDDRPQHFPQRHAAETIIVEVECPMPKAILLHVYHSLGAKIMKKSEKWKIKVKKISLDTNSQIHKFTNSQIHKKEWDFHKPPPFCRIPMKIRYHKSTNLYDEQKSIFPQ